MDWVKLIEHRRWCECHKTSGLYVDMEVIFIKGPCIPFGINNHSWRYAQQGQLATFEGWFYHTGYIETSDIHREDHYETRKVIDLGRRLERLRKYKNRETVGESA
jgi:hypothetical protein